jgi:hypothetical protein
LGAEGEPMIGPSDAVRVMVATKPVDFRKGAEGLATLVREEVCMVVRGLFRSTECNYFARAGYA